MHGTVHSIFILETLIYKYVQCIAEKNEIYTKSYILESSCVSPFGV